ncbi:MAG: acyl-[acyl-carrier-protein] thioesterase [Saprospiraceae bacterium]
MPMLSDQYPLGYEEVFTVRTYEIDNRKKATPAALVRLMQEAAMQNVIQIKLSVWDLEPHQISWVLTRLNLHIHRLPDLNERIRILTYPRGFEKFFTHRDYRIFDADNQLIAHSSSTWLLMDTQNRKMARMPEFILAFNARMPRAEDCLPIPSDKRPKFERTDRHKQYEVNWHDLDFNMHLNNTLYIQWMLETVEDHILEKGYLKELDIVFRMEALWKESIQSELQRIDNQNFLHRLLRKNDGKELAAMQTRWVFPSSPGIFTS